MSTADSLPTPPWSAARERPAGPAAKAPLTREAILTAALVLLDADGLEGVSMRRVAQRLNTGPASLYQHVGGKDELLELVLDRLCADITVPPPVPGAEGWQEPLKELLRAVRAMLVAHQDIAYVMLGRIPTGPNALTVTEGMLDIMRAGGVSAPIAAFAVDSLGLFVASVAYEDAIRARQFGTGEKALAYIESIHRYFAELPVDRFPTLVAMADHLADDGGHDGRFEFGLDVQIRGIAALAAEQRD